MTEVDRTSTDDPVYEASAQVGADVGADVAPDSPTHPSPPPGPASSSGLRRILSAVAPLRHLTGAVTDMHPAFMLTYAAGAVFAVVFGRLGVQHHRNFGTWSYDMGIYDQAYWLVSRFSSTFITVRGLEFWGHHINIVAYLYVPFYWLGAGPAFLYVSQAVVLGLGAIPTFLIARDRFGSPWAGLACGVAFLMYAPVQWISWANYHPEALVITPLLFAWWLAGRRHWRAFLVALLLALSTREDTALAVIMMGVVLTGLHWASRRHDRRSLRWSVGTIGIGALWYALATKVIIPGQNGGREPFYITYFYGDFGKSSFEIAKNMVLHPDRVAKLAVMPDRARFYRDLLLPMGGLPLLGLPFLAMAGPQMLASITGSSPYARQIMYQYTSVMIAPIVIATIEGTSRVLRSRALRYGALCWLLACSYVSNTGWSPSPLSPKYSVWAVPNDRVRLLDAAVAAVPGDARVVGTYSILPHLSGRRYAYDWPNPWQPAYWGDDQPDGSHVPAPHDPNTVEYIALDMYHVGAAQLPLIAQLIGDQGQGGEFEVVYRSHIKRPDPLGITDPTEPTGLKQVEILADQVIVAKRIRNGPPSTAR